jgi:hypothetical protein
MKLWAGWAHFQDFAVQVRAVESDDGHFRFGIGLHLNKSESSGQTSRAIGHHFEPLHSAVFFKQRPDVPFGYVQTEVPNKNVIHNLPFIGAKRSYEIATA